MISGMTLLAGVASAVTVGLVMRLIFPPARTLISRLQPYLAPTRTTASRSTGGPVSTLFGPMVQSLAEFLGRVLERSGDQVTILKLRQAGWYRDAPEAEAVATYRLAQLRSVGLAVGVAVIAGHVLGLSPLARLLLAALGLIVGGTRQKSSLDSAIERRREQMRIEIYTINQLLAMRVRAGGGVVGAVQQIVRRGEGEVVAELSDALRLHRSGWRAGDAFRRIAELTPEPFCGRTYRLLATAEERGADLAPALLDLAEDVRETRRESIRRSATKRRAAMLVPTIAILAPVLILFVAAPLPYLITGWR